MQPAARLPWGLGLAVDGFPRLQRGRSSGEPSIGSRVEAQDTSVNSCSRDQVRNWVLANFGQSVFSGVGRLAQHRYGTYDPSPVVSSRTCLASSTNEPGTSTSLGPADRKSGASKPR